MMRYNLSQLVEDFSNGDVCHRRLNIGRIVSNSKVVNISKIFKQHKLWDYLVVTHIDNGFDVLVQDGGGPMVIKRSLAHKPLSLNNKLLTIYAVL